MPPRPDCFVMNIGDLLERWTNGRFKSTLHRVVNTGRERYSTAFFLGEVGVVGGGGGWTSWWWVVVIVGRWAGVVVVARVFLFFPSAWFLPSAARWSVPL